MTTDLKPRQSLPPRQRTSKALARTIFKGDLPEEKIRELPVQTLYIVMKQNGLASSAELIEILTPEQREFFIDLDCWERDEFHEEGFWEWLSLPDAVENLEILKLILNAIDIRIMALMFARYVTAVLFDDPSDEPPGPGFYTPDNGQSWIQINNPDSHRHFLLGRMIALIFDNQPRLYYRLIQTTASTTQSEIQEEAYQEKTRRLQCEGIPDGEMAARMNAPGDRNQILSELASEKSHPIVEQIPIIEPLVFDGGIPEPLSTLLKKLDVNTEHEAELTLILNAAIVHFQVAFYEPEQVELLSAMVKGAINIGLEIAIAESSKSDKEIYDALGLQKLYQLGLSSVFGLKRVAAQVTDDELRDLINQPEIFQAIAGLRETFPRIPVDGSEQSVVREGQRQIKYQAIERLQDVKRLEAILSNLPRSN